MRSELALGLLALTLAFVGGGLVAFALMTAGDPTAPAKANAEHNIVTAGTTTPPVRYEK